MHQGVFNYRPSWNRLKTISRKKHIIPCYRRHFGKEQRTHIFPGHSEHVRTKPQKSQSSLHLKTLDINVIQRALKQHNVHNWIKVFPPRTPGIQMLVMLRIIHYLKSALYQKTRCSPCSSCTLQCVTASLLDLGLKKCMLLCISFRKLSDSVG